MSKLTDEITAIEKHNEQLYTLCGEILGTLRVSISRREIMFKHPKEGSECFYELMKYWQTKLDQLNRLNLERTKS